MSIYTDQTNKIITLQTKNTTYQMQIDAHNVLLHLYYGRRTAGTMEYLLTYADRGFSGQPYDLGNNREYSLDALPQEYPCTGTGDFRSPAINIVSGNGAEGCDFRYISHSITSGKYALKGLPAVYSDDTSDDAQTLDITMMDEVLGLELHLLYGVLPKMDIITRSAILVNRGEESVHIEKMLSANLDFLSGDYDLLTFHGRHGMERNLSREHVGHFAQVIGSRRGMSSHQYNPMMILAQRDATETAGTCYAMQFVYSGGFVGLAEKDQFEQTRMQLGLMEEKFFYPLAPGEEFTSPEVIMTCSTAGLERISINLHRCLRTRVCRGKWRDEIRPVLINSWEACYMDFNGADILELAEQARDLGMDMVVMDDGWFGKRNDDNSGLGDWFVNEEKLGGQLVELIRCIHKMDLQFGIWIEPEMVNEDSDLFREHPDWALSLPGRKPVRARNQLVLDFSRKEVVDEIFDRICKVLDQETVDYVKWDYNRSIADVYSETAAEQGRVLYDYILGLYDFLERLHQRYPDMLVEGCSGGGGRFDAGMLYYTPQIWCSDNTDAIDRLRIQYGTSFGYPTSSVGAHVSACPNEQNGRITSMHTRGIVAMSGTFGYEMNPAKLSDAEKREIRRQILKRNKYAGLIHGGDYYRLTSPYKKDQQEGADVAAWEIASEDGSEALVSAVILQIHCNRPVSYVRLRGLTSGALYKEEISGKIYPADALMETGLPMPIEMGEYLAYQWHFERMN